MSQRTTCLVPLLSLVLLPTLAGANTHVHATGRLVVNEDGQWKGMRSAKIELKDSDVDTDDTLDTTSTDDNGYFTLDGYGGDSGSDSIKKPDIYVKISLVHNGLADVTDEVGTTHTCRTATLEEFSGTHDFGTIHCTHPTPSRLWFRSMTERTWFKDQTGDSFPDGEINVHYPNSFPGNYTFYETLHISESSSMFHELGHRIRHALDGDLVHWNWDNTSFVYASATHDDFTVANTQGFAFNEGFAKFHKTYFDSFLRDHYRTWTPISGGEYNEGNVAHDLVLLSERTCSDGNEAGFWRMYQTLKQNPGYIHSRHQFVEKFEALFPECPETGTAKQTIINWHFSDFIDMTMSEHLNWIDSNSAAQWQGQMPSWMPREAQHIYDLSENERHHWDTTARATYRAIAADGARYFPQWYASGSLPEQERKMRERMVTTVARQRITDLSAMRSALARDLAATPAGPLRDFYANLDVRYQRIISGLQAALAAPTTGPFPEGIIPASFSSSVAAAR
jgi:hypothetical protein